MRQLHYAGESLTVDTDVCTAIFEYACALAGAARSAVVQVPILFGGERQFSNMLLGPASLLFCTPAPDSAVDLTDDRLIAELRERTRALGPSQAAAMPSDSDDDHDLHHYGMPDAS